MSANVVPSTERGKGIFIKNVRLDPKIPPSVLAESDETRIMGINGWRARMLRASSTLSLVKSPDPQEPFVAVNCGAITESPKDSVLFGHEKGAFTGAAGRHRGYFEQAEGGTLFLDEVAYLTPSTLVRLLRVLQNRELTRLGGETPLPTDVRVISASKIRWMLSLSPPERMEHIEGIARSLAELRELYSGKYPSGAPADAR